MWTTLKAKRNRYLPRYAKHYGQGIRGLTARALMYRLVQNSQHVLFAENKKLFVAQLHLGAGVFGKENALAGLNR